MHTKLKTNQLNNKGSALKTVVQNYILKKNNFIIKL